MSTDIEKAYAMLLEAAGGDYDCLMRFLKSIRKDEEREVAE